MFNSHFLTLHDTLSSIEVFAPSLFSVSVSLSFLNNTISKLSPNFFLNSILFYRHSFAFMLSPPLHFHRILAGDTPSLLGIWCGAPQVKEGSNKCSD